MFDDLYKAANREIPVDSALKTATVQKMLTHQSPKKTRHAVRYSFATAALALVLVAVYLFTNKMNMNGSLKPFDGKTASDSSTSDSSQISASKSVSGTQYAAAGAIAVPNYPQVGDNAEQQQREENQTIDKTFLSNESNFSYHSASVILANQNKKANSIYSPASLYMSMAMLAESSKGQTQSQVLNALSMKNMNLVSSQTGKLFRSLYYDDDFGKLNMANSIWLNKNVAFKKTFLQKLATDCYAHSFNYDFSDEDTSKKISEWVQKYTGGKLGGNAQDFQTNSQMAMMQLNTVYFYGQWSDKFDAKKTKKDVFYLSDGSKVSDDFMNMKYDLHYFMKGDGYTSASLSFKNGEKMVFVLPDKGVSPYNLLADTNKVAEAVNPEQSKEKFGQVTFKIPKFKFSTKMDLNDSLKALGVKAAFDSSTSDFSEISDSKSISLSKIQQQACISIDEKGCEAAAFTFDAYGTGGAPEITGKADMILDRPFIFAILGTNDVPLFIGVVNNPNA